jgi:hypothetical protein
MEAWMTEKFEVTDAMVEAAKTARNLYLDETPAEELVRMGAMRAAITAAIKASGLVEENARLRKASYKAFTDGMEAAAQICGTLAEVEYDDADGFEAATGCEAAIMRVVNEQRTEQALNKEPTL